MSKAARLRREWGDKPCDHPQIEKEYYLGSDTGDYVCIRCGRLVDPERQQKRRQGRRSPRSGRKISQPGGKGKRVREKGHGKLRAPKQGRRR